MKKKLSEDVRDQIEELIAFGKLAPGEHLDETELAERFGVSRTPIREALNQLATAGLVEIRARRGAVVAQFNAQQLVEMFEVMGEFEGMCGRLAARRLTDKEQKELLDVHEECKRAIAAGGDPDQYYQLNDKFHGVIYRGSHNEFLMEQAWGLRRRLRPYRRLQLRVRGRISNSLDEHEAIVQAILKGDGEKANELLRQHVMVQGQRFADLVASLPLLHAKSAA
ncbi:MAG TPA: GntR family transcriptional regulator [Limnobacter sp.]|nr:GntR family transcriptional regulator [Limnobacter sp.]